MAGKPQLPSTIHRRIRRLRAAGKTFAAIMEAVGCSLYTVRVALRKEYRAEERARHRARWADVKAHREGNDAYAAYQHAYADRPEYRDASRARMAALRAARFKRR
jgi:hypothetical protein